MEAEVIGRPDSPCYAGPTFTENAAAPSPLPARRSSHICRMADYDIRHRLSTQHSSLAHPLRMARHPSTSQLIWSTKQYPDVIENAEGKGSANLPLTISLGRDSGLLAPKTNTPLSTSGAGESAEWFDLRARCSQRLSIVQGSA